MLSHAGGVLTQLLIFARKAGRHTEEDEGKRTRPGRCQLIPLSTVGSKQAGREYDFGQRPAAPAIAQTSHEEFIR
jgi:hypothetical protein